MKYLLDTSALLWFLADDRRLGASNRSLIQNPATDIFVSLASLWELAIKFNIGKLTSPLSFNVIVNEIENRNSFRLLEIKIMHLERYVNLPRVHRDPFDRLLIAQSLAENLPIITNDAAFDQYRIQRVW